MESMLGMYGEEFSEIMALYSAQAAVYSVLIVIVLIFQLIFWIVRSIGVMKMLSKAGEPAWTGLIPIYSTYKLSKVAKCGEIFIWLLVITYGSSVISALLLMIPIVGALLSSLIPIAVLVLRTIIYKHICKAYGMDSWGAAILMLFLFFVMTLMLGFNKNEYQEPENQVTFKGLWNSL